MWTASGLAHHPEVRDRKINGWRQAKTAENIHLADHRQFVVGKSISAGVFLVICLLFIMKQMH